MNELHDISRPSKADNNAPGQLEDGSSNLIINSPNGVDDQENGLDNHRQPSDLELAMLIDKERKKLFDHLSQLRESRDAVAAVGNKNIDLNDPTSPVAKLVREMLPTMDQVSRIRHVLNKVKRYILGNQADSENNALRSLFNSLEKEIADVSFKLDEIDLAQTHTEASILKKEIETGTDSSPNQEILTAIGKIRLGEHQKSDSLAVWLITSKLATGMTLDEIEDEVKDRLANNGALSEDEIAKRRMRLADANEAITTLIESIGEVVDINYKNEISDTRQEGAPKTPEHESPPSVEQVFRLLGEHQRELGFYQVHLERIRTIKQLLTNNLPLYIETGPHGGDQISGEQLPEVTDVLNRLKEGDSSPFRASLLHKYLTGDNPKGLKTSLDNSPQTYKQTLERLLEDLESTVGIPQYWVDYTELKLRKEEAALLEQEIFTGIDSEPHQDILNTITLMKARAYQVLNTTAFQIIMEKQYDLGMTLDQIEEEARVKIANGGQLTTEEIRQKQNDLDFAKQRIQVLETPSPTE